MKPKKAKPQLLKPFIIQILRKATYRWKARNQALVNARVSRGKYKCASCGGLFGPKEINIDHIQPVVDPKVGFTNFEDYIQRMFCEVDGFQILCNGGGKDGEIGGCHGVKCQIEKEMRKHYKELDKQAKEE